MNFKKAVEALGKTRGIQCTIKEALTQKYRWDAYWMLYSTPEAKDDTFCNDTWLDYVNYIWSKPEC